MGYIHYDLADLEASMRQLHKSEFAARIASARSPAELDGYHAQDRFMEPQIKCQIEMIRLLNEGRDAAFIGKTVGSFLANLIVNTLAASPEQAVTLAHMTRVINNAMAVLNGNADDSIQYAHTFVRGETGGRA